MSNDSLDDMGACQSAPITTDDRFTQAGIIIVKKDVSEKQTSYELNYNGHSFQYIERSDGSSSLRNMRNYERCVMENAKQYVDTIKYVADHNDYPVVNIQVWHSDHGLQREVRFHFNADKYGYVKLIQTLKLHHVRHSEMTPKRYIAALINVPELERLKLVLKGTDYQWIDFTTPRP